MVTVVQLSYVVAAAAFILGLHRMSSPATARNGNIVSAVGMAIAVVATAILLLTGGITSLTPWMIIIVGTIIGGGAGFYLARTVQMTAMPQMVSLFNAAGGGAAALVAIDEFIKLGSLQTFAVNTVPLHVMVATLLGVAFGSITFTGSLVAFGKLQGLVPGRPVTFAGSQFVNLGLFLALVLSAGYLVVTGQPNVPLLLLLTAVALVLGVTTTMPIGGADMPVVISLLNSFTGIAAAMAGFVINNPALIIAGALVGASGAILTQLMAKAMNRSLYNILFGAFGTGDSGAAAGADGGYAGGGSTREIGEDDAAVLLAYARSVIIVPGYGLAVAQAQHNVRELADLLEKRGVEVKYAIHPVAGRMPGHMNVLLAEANVPYPQLIEMDEINPEFPRTDVVLVVGANDVTNPAARSNPASPIFGMPILDVDQAQNIIVIKRSMRPGFAGIDNELYVNAKTGMLFGDAKEALGRLVNAVKAV
ncbi:MAG: NAD(P)(+) transhydrogenase (Re/Si-specific) subunit beta [Chloroflexi bacterium]|nr:NAD(P)(+) transhydrogenase (Re/Si-specific) subunit beta [Chloroflexota bacterium]